MADPTPTSIGRYRILRRLGAGGMGAVYLASDPALDRHVAIKLIRAGAGSDAESHELRQRFAREARSVGRLHHPNIITIFDVGEHGGEAFIAMEFVEGQTLKVSIARASDMPLSRKLKIIDQLFAGLEHAHQGGVIHRDVKPANVMVSEKDHVKILDFGLARGFARDLTQSGMMMGTVPYMSPEQLRGKPVDQRTDIYSAGVVFYELLSGRPAFPSTIDAGALHFILEAGAERIEALCPGLDLSIAEIVRRCMARASTDRYADLGIARRELASALRRVPDDLEPESPSRTVTQAIVPVPAPKTPGPGTREELIRLRRERIKDHMSEAHAALAREDFPSALSACRQALIIDPENDDAHGLHEQIQATADAHQLLAQARDHLDRGAVTAASRLVNQLLQLKPDMPEVAKIRDAVASLRQRFEEAARRTRLVDEALTKCRTHLQADELDSASSALSEVVALDPANTEAAALKNEIAAKLEAQRREQAQARENARAQSAVDAAGAEFARGAHAAAIATLRAYQPGHPGVTAAISALEAEWREIERRGEEQRLREAARRTQLVADALTTCRAHVQRGDFDSAASALEAVRALDAANADAVALQRELTARLEAQRRAQVEAQEDARARSVVDAAAIASLRGYQPAHPRVAAAISALQAEWRDIERKAEPERQRDEAERRQIPHDEAAIPVIALHGPREDDQDPAATVTLLPSSTPSPASRPAHQRDERPTSVSRAAALDEPPLFREPVKVVGSGRARIIGVLAAMTLLGIGWLLFGRGSAAAKPPVVPSRAVVRLDITPWANVESVTRKSDGKIIDVGKPSTPCVLSLDPGDYHIRARNPLLPKAVLDFDVSVVPGEQDVRRPLPGVNLENELKKILAGGKG